MAAFGNNAALLATALLAYGFGLRHAVDADHIAAIDNVVRKLMHAGDAPKSVGLYFALGHSTVVVVATMLLALGVVGLGGDGLLREIGGLIGTSVSALFLLVIAAINLAIFAGLWRRFRIARALGVHDSAPRRHSVVEQCLHQFVAGQRELGPDAHRVRLVVRPGEFGNG